MSLTEEGYERRKWENLEMLRTLLADKPTPPDSHSSIHYGLVEKIGDLHNVYDLCICNLKEFNAKNEITYSRVRSELGNLEYDFQRLSDHFREMSEKIKTVALGIGINDRS